MHGRFGGFGRNEDIAGDAVDRPLGDQEAVALAMHVQAADDELAAAGGHLVMFGTKLNQIAPRRQAGQRGF